MSSWNFCSWSVRVDTALKKSVAARWSEGGTCGRIVSTMGICWFMPSVCCGKEKLAKLSVSSVGVSWYIRSIS